MDKLTWYWRCPKCEIPEQKCEQTEARALADNHDKQTHKGAPLTAFGWQKENHELSTTQGS